MRRKTRTITVNNQQYVWWNRFNENGVGVVISPIHDKTSTVTVEFPRKLHDQTCNEKQISTGNFPEYISIKKNNKESCIKTIEPKMVSLLLTQLSNSAFKHRQNNVYNGLDLIAEMGYTITKIKNGMYW